MKFYLSFSSLPLFDGGNLERYRNVKEDLYGNKLGMLTQECKTRWSATHIMGLSLMKAQESIQQFCVQEKLTDVDGKNFKMGVEDWDIIGQCTVSLMTIAAV